MFSLLTIAVLTIVLPSVANGAFCDYVLTKDCFHTADTQEVCGTNGKTYRNSCALAKDYCNDNTIHLKAQGACVAPVTTPAPVDGGSIALDIFCLDISYIDCGSTGPRVCGSDGKFYDNLCEFDKARCFHRTIHSNGVNCS